MFSEVLSASAVERANDEDLCCQFNYLWSSFILAALALGVSLIQYVGDPIECWCPAQMPQAQCNYTKALCWVKENYYKHQDENIDILEKDRYNITMSYYPWVPWMLFFMSAMLCMPHIVWGGFAKSSGLNIHRLIELADAHEDPKALATILRIWLVRTNRSHSGLIERSKRFLAMLGFFWFGKHHRSYLCGLLIFVKLLYVLISVTVYLFLNVFIGEDYISYGYDVVINYLHGIPTRAEGFPIQTICDIRLRHMSNIHTYSIQCILPINLFNEKIFLFLWFWFQLLITVNVYSFLKWAYHLLSFANRWKFLKEYVIIHFHLLQRGPPKSVDENANTISANRSNVGEDLDLYPSMHRPLIPASRSTRSFPMRRCVKRDTFLADHRREKKYGLVSSIETSQQELEDMEKMRKINQISRKMMKHIGHDGVLVFRILQDATGIVVANHVFQELYEQLNATFHYS